MLLKLKAYLGGKVACTLNLIHTFILAVGKGVSLVEVHVAERICKSDGFFFYLLCSYFINELPLLWIVFYV